MSETSHPDSFVERHWLNPSDHHDTGHVKVAGSITTYSYGGDVENRPSASTSFYGSFELADCSRKVSLDFHCGSKREVNQRLKKVRKLISSLQRLESLLETSHSLVGIKKG